MSIANEIIRLQNAKTRLNEILGSKGINTNNKLLQQVVEMVEDLGYTDLPVSSINYLRTLPLNSTFDESAVAITVDFPSGSKTYYQNDLTFNYSEFNNSTPEKQTIYATINEINQKVALDVMVSPQSLKILALGNSYSVDTLEYMHQIASSLGVNFELHGLSASSCYIDEHIKNIEENNNAYLYYTFDAETNTWTYPEERVSLQSVINNVEWDYIWLQQGSKYSGESDSYVNLPLLKQLVLELAPNVRFLWNITWAYQGDVTATAFDRYNRDQIQMYEGIINAVKANIDGDPQIDYIMPVGTVIQNMRTSYMGDTLCRDNSSHLTVDLGRYIAALTAVATLTGLDISNVSYNPGLDYTMKSTAIECVKNALIAPYKIANTQVSEEDYRRRLVEEYEVFNWQPVGSAFWKSTDGTNYNKLITNEDGASIKFIASQKRFSKEELPVGSIIEIKKGYKYRPECWVEDSAQSSRPSEIKTKFIEIEDNWWENILYRAFNVSSNDGESLMYNQKNAAEALTIYIPKNKFIHPELNPYATNDENLFNTHNLNINDYELLNYFFSNGYYNSSTSEEILKITYTPSNCLSYLCTEGFDRNSLPVGSVLVLDSGYQYRPEFWTGEGKNTSRPGNSSASFAILDDAWWSTYVARAFNIRTTAGDIINQIPYETAAHFRIYVPKFMSGGVRLETLQYVEEGVDIAFIKCCNNSYSGIVYPVSTQTSENELTQTLTTAKTLHLCVYLQVEDNLSVELQELIRSAIINNNMQNNAFVVLNDTVNPFLDIRCGYNAANDTEIPSSLTNIDFIVWDEKNGIITNDMAGKLFAMNCCLKVLNADLDNLHPYVSGNIIKEA